MRLILPLLLTLFMTTLLGCATTETSIAAAPAEPDQTLTKEAAAAALKGIQGEVLSVEPAEVPGLYLVSMRMQGKTVPLYLDTSGSYLFSGNVIRLKDRKNLTEAHYQRLNPVDISTIPLDAGMTLGDPAAAQQILVFTDPHCPYCSKLHQVLHEAVATNTEFAFHIKLLPFKASSKKVAQTIICNQSMELLDQAFSGQTLSKTAADDCNSDAISNNLNLASKLGIRGTPTLILPNGRIVTGYRPLEELLKLIEENRIKTQ